MNITWNTNLRNRLIVGFTGGPLLLAAAFYGRYVFLIVMALVIFLSLHELHMMGRAINFRKHTILSYIYSAAVIIDLYFYAGRFTVIATVLYLSAILLQAIFVDDENSLYEVSFNCLSTLYVTLFLGSLILIRELPYGPGLTGFKMLAAVFLGVWFLDTFAYFAGRMFGKHKLFPRISPKKTVEGSVGGLAGCFAVMLLVRTIFIPEISITDILFLSLIISIGGQFGDLIESFFKRQTGIKDSSSILPGHGGILDRFDSLIFVSPFVYYYIKWMIAA